ncbi:MAG: hypothetical protein AB1894_20050 [Chloroflexota bacterium]
MNDIHELIGQGIIAARKGKRQQAIRLLTEALCIQPRNPRVWLWLAAVMEDDEKRRYCLEQVQRLDPQAQAARVLLERIDGAQAEARPAQVQAFTCSQCGGRLRYDPDLGSLACEHCGTSEQVYAPDAADAEQDLQAALRSDTADEWAVFPNQITCEQCGAVTLLEADQIANYCPFCASAQVVLQPATPGLIEPHAIIPFAFDEKQARDKMRRWLGAGLFLPDDLLKLARPKRLTPIYLPFWTFDGRVRVPCLVSNPRMRIPRVEARVTTAWDEMAMPDVYERDFDDLLIYAAQALSAEALRDVQPFETAQARAYQPQFLAGWEAQAYQISLVDASLEAHKRMYDQAVLEAELEMLIPNRLALGYGDVLVQQNSYKLALLPVWVAAYSYRGQLY